MCGIAGIIHRRKDGDIGSEMTNMLEALRHRGPDSTGFALYGNSGNSGNGVGNGVMVMRYKLAEQEDLRDSVVIHDEIKKRHKEVHRRLKELGAEIKSEEGATEYAYRSFISYEGDLRKLAEFLEDIEGVEILSIGNSLELIKDLGDATRVSSQYSLPLIRGSHAIGHTRMATESDVDIRSAHPYWAYPFKDVSVVHNGQLTNYWTLRRALEHVGHRFVSNCDSELIAVYIADKMNKGQDLELSMRQSIEDLDGVFTYIVATSDSLGMAKDTMAAKPLVLYEEEETVALASEEIAIRSIFPMEIETFDPYDGEVRVWSR